MWQGALFRFIPVGRQRDDVTPPSDSPCVRSVLPPIFFFSASLYPKFKRSTYE